MWYICEKRFAYLLIFTLHLFPYISSCAWNISRVPAEFSHFDEHKGATLCCNHLLKMISQSPTNLHSWMRFVLWTHSGVWYVYVSTTVVINYFILFTKPSWCDVRFCQLSVCWDYWTICYSVFNGFFHADVMCHCAVCAICCYCSCVCFLVVTRCCSVLNWDPETAWVNLLISTCLHDP